MADLTAELTRLNLAFDHWQLQLLGWLQGRPVNGQPRGPDSALPGPVLDGWQLLVAPASRRGRAIRHGLNGVISQQPMISDGSQPDMISGWQHSNQLLSEHFDCHDGVCSGPVAAHYCRTLGPDWYLPSKDELSAILAMASELDSLDSSAGVLTFSALAASGQACWSSSRHSLHNSWTVQCDTLQTVSRNRSSAHPVIPVRRVPVQG